MNDLASAVEDHDPQETLEWLGAFEDVLARWGPARGAFLLERLHARAAADRALPRGPLVTPQVNTIAPADEPDYPGDEALEERLEAVLRWNAVATVTRANERHPGLGGHLSTYASMATVYEVAYHHFFRGRDARGAGDQVFFQGHGSPGLYARAVLEGRLDWGHLERFREELSPQGGLSSYPHPWLMPSFWQFPTVSMGLAALSAIYQARFNRYLAQRGLADTSGSRVWCFLGDGEMDEPESQGALTVASREGLDNLTFVVNCNLQRLDGPVRGNGSVVRELEGLFRGAGWNVVKVLWSREWDELFAADEEGRLARLLGDTVDGELQRLAALPPDRLRAELFGRDPACARLVEGLDDAALAALKRGGHDRRKVHAGLRAAVEHRGQPSVVLVHTVKGWGLGSAAEGRNAAHQAKSLHDDALGAFARRFGLELAPGQLEAVDYVRPDPEGPEVRYLRERRAALGGPIPRRVVECPAPPVPSLEALGELLADSGGREVSTTMAFVRLLARLLKEPGLGPHVVPIVPDEARTFGMEALFRQVGIYAPFGQRYEPIDKGTVLYYREARDGQLLQEGISEAGALASFTAAGTAYATHGVPAVPFYIYYSMFGFQRVMDLIWAASDARARGFLLGATAGRTTLNGEGLQHQDGHGHLLAAAVPHLRAYDPAYAFEVTVLVQDGLRRMYVDGEPGLTYLTLYNENYEMPAMPDGAAEGVVRGMYLLRAGAGDAPRATRPQLFGSGSLLREALRAQALLAERFGVAADVWSVTSYSELCRDGLAVERLARLHPDRAPPACWVTRQLEGLEGPFVATSDNVQLVPRQIAPWVPGPYLVLGTDGFGRSDTRAALRRHFEVDAEHVVAAALRGLVTLGRFDAAAAARAIRDLGLDPEAPDPARA